MLADVCTLREEVLDNKTPAFHNAYALTKFTNEQQIKLAARTRGLDATILRFFNIFGPGEEYTPYRSVICQFAYRLLTGQPVTVYKNTSRSFLYVDDWARAVANVLNVKTGPAEAFNIGSPKSYDLCTVYNIVSSVVGSDVDVRTELTETCNVAHKAPDVNKAATFLGLRDTVDLREGVERTVAWMRRWYELG